MAEVGAPSYSIIEQQSATPVVPEDQLPQGICRDRYGRFNSSFFPLLTCSLCYTYLFPGEEHFVFSHARWAFDLRTVDGDRLPGHIALYPNLLQGGFGRVRDQIVCQRLGEDRCERLAQCCSAAIRCCKDQVLVAQQNVDKGAHRNPSCPYTWDGFACFRDTQAGRIARVQCPSYLYALDTAAEGTKTCMANGTWWRSSTNGKEWTDYSACVNIEGYRYLYYAGVSMNAISLICLVPACVIFLSFKQLLKQHRIRIHVNLFLTFILTNASWLWWDYRVFRDRLESSQDSAFMHSDSALCRFQYVITRYSWSCNFAWMSLEGLHLYRLINHAFKPPKSICSYYFIGWLLPCLPTCVYCIIREAKNHSVCWVQNAGYLEWIMYGPNLLCVSLNVIFLAIILKILLTQLQTHPNEPSNYRRALKATCILVPLFGLQFFLYVYRPFQDGDGYIFYEIFAKIVNNSQGATVAIVFCFLNSEVHTYLRSHLMRSRSRNWHQEARSYTLSTEGRRVSAKGSNIRLECIPLTNNGTTSGRDITGTSGLPGSSKKCRVNLNRKGTSNGAIV